MDYLINDARIAQALKQQTVEKQRLIDLAIEIQQIPSPTFDEGRRALFVEQKFTQMGLENVTIDPLDNVMGRLIGRNASAKPIIITAHTDTVFPEETDLTIRREKDRVHGPGIADNSAGVAGLLTLAETLLDHKLQPQRDIWFVANVGEEGMGDLRGMRAVTNQFSDAAGFIVIEGGMFGYILHEAIGVRRFSVEVEVDGGHSWSDFGRTSAIHILGHIIRDIDTIRVPKSPKTTFNVGRISGGTSINTIAANASLQLDLRSEAPNALDNLIAQFESIIRNTRQQFSDARISVNTIGDRPAGSVPRNNWLVRSADNALRATGFRNIKYLRGSTDANIPLSQNFPAVCIGLTRSANAHRLDEFLDTTELPRGMQQLLLLALDAANYEQAD